eukprot:CAMPEP_0197186912 /NCGR_PEP_ID=MMETSP1423-20130617/14858_1 /TAXON_ID=476441 /ORGANISM="Pseudo-nitzschia heimii, Strain UNC1101" /LENGTH=421 /DNA_ID=CAMNT_0042638349 /DNA_START=49 /DNA_END=1314 /DNA_ORIENTATION=+
MGMAHHANEKKRRSLSFFSTRVMMLWILAWIALFLDALECFSPQRIHIPSETLQTSLLSSTTERQATDGLPREQETTDITITLPSYAVDHEASFPSPLHRIHVRSLLSDDEVSMALKLAIDHAELNSSFDNPDAERHVSYATCDFAVDECEQLETLLESSEFQQRLFGQFSELYNVDTNDLSFNDLFVAYYQSKPDGDNGDFEDENNIMDRLELHRDGSIFSFSLLLNPPEEFHGGGTFYDALRDIDPADYDHGILHAGGAIRPERAGDAVLHCGKILHGADVVTRGRRVVLVGFVDLSKRCIRKGILGNACKEWGREDVAMYRFKRQERKNHKGWVLNNSRWLSNANNHSVIRGFVPASRGVVRRAGSEASRLRRLQTEDVLLQNILLLPEERGPKDDSYHQFSFDDFDDGSISFLPEAV